MAQFTHAKHMVGQLAGAAQNYSRQPTVSPVTLNHSWPKLSRLLLCLALSISGSLLNGFFVAAFFVEESLKKVGNVFICCLGLADLAVTGVVVPMSAVVLLSGQGDSPTTCHYQQLIVTTAVHAYILLYMLVGAEHFYRVTHANRGYTIFTSMRVSLVAVMVASMSFALAAAGTYFSLDFDFCERRHSGNIYYRLTTAALMFATPICVTGYYLVGAAIGVHRRAREAQYRRSQQFERDNSQATLNIISYVVFLSSWAPYTVTVYQYPDLKDTTFYNLAWLGILRCVYGSAMYTIANRSFRRAYLHLFNYCCCKNSLAGSFASRHRRALDYRTPCGDVRVHIMHQAVNVNSPLRAGLAARETQEL